MSLQTQDDYVGTSVQFQNVEEIDFMIESLRQLRNNFEVPDLHIHLMAKSQKDVPIADTEIIFSTLNCDGLDVFNSEFSLNAQQMLEDRREARLQAEVEMKDSFDQSTDSNQTT